MSEKMDIVCPSGLSGRVRGVVGTEFNVFTDQRAMRDGRAADRILSLCWEETDDAGPYQLQQGRRLNWGDVLVGDRTYALLMMRCCTYGPIEELDMRCVNCKQKFVWELPLDKLDVRPFPRETVERIASRQNEFLLETHAGDKVWFKMLTGRDQRQGAKAMRERGEAALFETIIKQRIVRVEGLDRKDHDQWFARLGGRDLQEFIDRMDEQDGGVETRVDIYCPSCGFEWEIDVPLDLDRMFTPRRRRTRGVPRARAFTEEEDTGSLTGTSSSDSSSSDDSGPSPS